MSKMVDELMGPPSRKIVIDGLTVSEVLFRPDDGWPLCYGYMVGEDDGKSGLHVTPEKAVEAYRNKVQS